MDATGDVETMGNLEAAYLREKAASFKIGGVYSVGASSHNNLDNAITFSADATVTGAEDGTGPDGIVSDVANIIINAGVTLTLGSNMTFNADSDANGTGAFLMDSTAAIAGGNHTLEIHASGASTLGTISNVSALTLGSQSGQVVTYTAGNKIGSNAIPVGALTINASTMLKLNSQELDVSGLLTNNGTLALVGDETLNLNHFTDNGTVQYYGNDSYAITPIGAYKNLEFRDGTFTLGGAVTAANLANYATLDLNGKALHVTGALTNNGLLMLVGNETPSLGSFSDNGTVQYYGSGPQTIIPLGTYNNVEFSNGTFTLNGPTLSAQGNISIDDGAKLNLQENTIINGGSFGMGNTTAEITGGDHTLGIYVNDWSTLGRISGVTALTLGNQNTSTPIYNAYNAISVEALTINASTNLYLYGSQELSVTDSFTNNGTLRLYGNEISSPPHMDDRNSSVEIGLGFRSIPV
jgi:hypothetical protein